MVENTQRQIKKVGDVSVSAGRGAGQLPWYEFVAKLVKGKTVLDVGCGLGKGLEILQRTSSKVVGQDLDPRLERPGIIITPVEEILTNRFDVVTAIDVIEHVKDDKNFVEQLCRIAREFIFLTTPNWTASRCQWPYHIREYTPKELEDILTPLGKVKLFKGSPDGSVVYPVNYTGLYHIANRLRIYFWTAFVTRCVNHFLPSSYRIHSHIAAILYLND